MFLVLDRRAPDTAEQYFSIHDAVIGDQTKIDIDEWTVGAGEHWLVQGRAPFLAGIRRALVQPRRPAGVAVAAGVRIAAQDAGTAPQWRANARFQWLRTLLPRRRSARESADALTEGLIGVEDVEFSAVAAIATLAGTDAEVWMIDRLAGRLRPSLRFRVAQFLRARADACGCSVITLTEQLLAGWTLADRFAVVDRGTFHTIAAAATPERSSIC